MAYVLQAEDAVDQEHGQPGREDVDGDAADDLVGAKTDRDHSMNQRHQAAGHDRHPGGQQVVVPGEVGDDAEEGARQHHALHGDVHHAAALRDHAAERRQEQKDGRGQRGLP